MHFIEHCKEYHCTVHTDLFHNQWPPFSPMVMYRTISQSSVLPSLTAPLETWSTCTHTGILVSLSTLHKVIIAERPRDWC